VIAILVSENGRTREVEHVDPAWLEPGATVRFWVDITNPDQADGQLMADVFHFHPLSVEDALTRIQFPKIELYDHYLYLILHGIDYRAHQHHFATRDIDFFVGANYLVTVHDGESRSMRQIAEMCARREHVLSEGPVALLHRIVDKMVDNYRPEIDALEARISKLEERAFSGHEEIVKPLLHLKRDLSSARRIVIPQRDVVGRLARREFHAISDEMTYRFRDVFDNLVRIADDAMIFQDRVNGVLDAHLSAVSNRLNEVMKVLTVMSTIFLPLTVLTGMWGMNIALPHLPGGDGAQFWWIGGMMVLLSGAMLTYFRRKGWI
jgi:magnesium transporter